jgi:hypothetical protein
MFGAIAASSSSSVVDATGSIFQTWCSSLIHR